MILFYKKENGKIISVIDGRVHNETHINFGVSNNENDEIGKYIIGWIENKKGKIEYNMDKFNILQRFEDNTSFSPLDCKIVDGELIT